MSSEPPLDAKTLKTEREQLRNIFVLLERRNFRSPNTDIVDGQGEAN